MFKRAILVHSNKGGVGKTFVAINIASILSRMGLKVGLMDADFYNPCFKVMMGLEDSSIKIKNLCEKGVEQERLVPYEHAGIKMVSLSFMLKPHQPFILRGPSTHTALLQFLTQTLWKDNGDDDLDVLVIDVPCGTGDIPQSLLLLLSKIPTRVAHVVHDDEITIASCLKTAKFWGESGIDMLCVIANKHDDSELSSLLISSFSYTDIFIKRDCEFLSFKTGKNPISDQDLVDEQKLYQMVLSVS